MRHIQLYSAEKYAATKNGNILVSINPMDYNWDQELISQEIQRIRNEQKLVNAEFKANRKLAKLGPVVPKPLAALNLPKSTEIVEIINRKEEVEDKLADQLEINDDIKIQLDPGTGNSTVILGSGKVGKTEAMLRIFDQCYANKDYISTAFCLNPQDKRYKSRKKWLDLYSGFDKKALELIQSHQRLNIRVDNKYPFVELFDDIIDTKYSKIINELVLTYRNSDISCIFCLQYTYLLSKMNRGTINNILIFNFNTDDIAMDCINIFLKGYFVRMGKTTNAEQLAFFKEMTSNHGFIYIKPAAGTISFHRLNLEKIKAEKDKKKKNK